MAGLCLLAKRQCILSPFYECDFVLVQLTTELVVSIPVSVRVYVSIVDNKPSMILYHLTKLKAVLRRCILSKFTE